MPGSNNSILQQIIKVIREAVNEDWIHDYEIDADTRFNDDLELESVEFVEIAEKLQQHFGSQLKFIDWLSSMNLDQIISLTVGDLERYVIDKTKA